jgi:hypothetical protein
VIVNQVLGNKYAFNAPGEKTFYFDFSNLPEAFTHIPKVYWDGFICEHIKYLSATKLLQTSANNSPSGWASQFVNIEVKHPVKNNQGTLYSIIIDLNDSQKWTREQIADWLETLDDTQNPVITKNTKENNNDNPF